MYSLVFMRESISNEVNNHLSNITNRFITMAFFTLSVKNIKKLKLWVYICFRQF